MIAPVKSESRVKAVPPTRSGILDLIKPIEVPCIRRPKRKPSPKMRTASSGIPDPSRKNRMNNMIGAYSIKLPCARMALFSSSSSPLPCAINANAGLPRRPITLIDSTNSQIANNEQYIAVRLGRPIFIVEIYWRSTPSMHNTATSLPQGYLNVRGNVRANVTQVGG